jgi:hypothetical protein
LQLIAPRRCKQSNAAQRKYLTQSASCQRPPPSLFLVGKDGKVSSRTTQINGLEDEIKKQLR